MWNASVSAMRASATSAAGGGGGDAGRAPGEAGEQRRQLGQGQAVIGAVAHQRVARHVRPGGVLGVLHHVDAAPRLERHQPGRAVVQQPGEHDAHGAVPGPHRRRAEQRIHRRAGAVLLRAAPHQQVPAVLGHQQVAVRRGQVDLPALDRLAVLGVACRQRPGPGEDRRHHRARGGRDVLHHQHRRRQVVRQGAAQAGQGIDAARRGADQDEVTGHVSFHRGPDRKRSPPSNRYYHLMYA
jgi:hypothetical protein